MDGLMNISQRVAIPSHLKSAKTVASMQAAVQELSQLDTPQALPILGDLDKRATGRIGLILNLIWNSLTTLMVSGVLSLILVAGELLLIGLYINVLYQLGWASFPMCGVIGLLWGGIILICDERVRKVLSLKLITDNIPFKGFGGTLLALGRSAASVGTFAVMFVGVSGMLLPVLYGFLWGFTKLWEKSPSIWLALGLPLAVIVVAVMSVFSIRLLPLSLLGIVGLWGLFDSQFSGVTIFFALAFALLWVLQLIHRHGGQYMRVFLRWESEVVATREGWRLRDMLDTAFDSHRQRNHKRIDGNGGRAFCQDHLVRFNLQQAGPVSFWWCPVCSDDAPAYTGVRIVRGVLDEELTVAHKQENDVLLISLLHWLNGGQSDTPPVWQEVFIGKLSNSHDIELFITHYQTLQAQNLWTSLHSMRCVTRPDVELDSNILRLIRSAFNT